VDDRPEEPPREVERQRDELKAALVGLLIAATVGPFIYWLMDALR
jgi:hypothetical protein